MNWYDREKKAEQQAAASSTNYSNLLNSAFGTGWGDMEADDAVNEIENPDKGVNEKKKKAPKKACADCCRPQK